MAHCSVSTSSLGTALRAALDWAGRNTASHVEIDGRRQAAVKELTQTARRQIRHLIVERSLQASGVLFPLRGGIADPDRLADRIELAFEVMQFARDIGAPSLVLPFRLPEEGRDRERTLDVVANLARHGDRVGCRLSLRTGESHELLRPFIQAASTASPIEIQYDPAAAVLSNLAIEAEFSSLADFITEIRVCDAVRSGGTFGRETMIGRGEVDFDLLAALAQQVQLRSVVVSPEDATISPLADGLRFAKAVFDSFGE